MPETILRVYILDIFNCGEFDCSLPFRSLDNARREACRRLAAALAVKDDEFATVAGVEDINEFHELVENMLELHKLEAYFGMLEVFDEWVTDGNFEGPPPFNYDITQRVVE